MSNKPTRRKFLKATTAAAATTSVVAAVTKPAQAFHHSVDETIKVGLIGCGGRGTSAAANALNADENVQITALADAFPDRLETCLETLTLNEKYAGRINVADDHKFLGFDCYLDLMASDIEVVLLCSPPHFRPAQMEAAVAADKQIFCEKPIATDAPGVRRVKQASLDAAAKGLNLVSGLCWRYDHGVTETIEKIKAGDIGEIQSIHSNYLTAELWHQTRKPEWSQMEYQCRNWLYFNWLSGDLIAEQHIHTLDKGLWLMDDEPPVACYGMGGRQKRTGDQWGNVYDHIATIFEWANGTKMHSYCRQMNGCFSENECHVIGTEGKSDILKNRITNKDGDWVRKGKKPSMYDVEHQELFKAIRGDRPTINNGDYMCNSTMMALMGRNASYTGQRIKWADAWDDETKLGPDTYGWNDYEAQPIAVPGTGTS